MARPSKFVGLSAMLLLVASFTKFACHSSSTVDTGEAASVSPAGSAKKLAQIRQERDKAKREVEENARVVEAQKQAARARLEQEAADAGAIEAARARALDADHLWLRDPGEQEIDGRLEAVGANWLSVRDGSGFEYAIRIDGQTRVRGGGQLGDLKKLPQGSQLRVGVVFQGKRRFARDIEIRAPYAADAS